MLDNVMEGKIKTVIVSNKDSFVQFGFDCFERFCEKYNTSITIVNNEVLSPNEELVQDIISILHVFICRLYGLKKYKSWIKGDEEIAEELQDSTSSNAGTGAENEPAYQRMPLRLQLLSGTLRSKFTRMNIVL